MGREDRIVLNDLSDEEDAAITAAAEADPDNPPLTDEQLARMQPIWAHPGQVAALRRGGHLPAVPRERRAVRLRLDPEVIARIGEGGEGRDERANALLRRALGLPEA